MVTSLSGSMLAAALLLGQAQDVQVIRQSDGKIVTYSSSSSSSSSSTTQTPSSPRPFLSWFSREDRPLKTRLQGWFGGRKEQEPPLGDSAPSYAPQPGTRYIEGTKTNSPAIMPTTPTPLDFPKKMPSPSSQANPPQGTYGAVVPAGAFSVQQTAAAQMSAGSVKSPILPHLANKIGRDEKFEWITGQLEMEHGAFVIYYATPETVDRFKGRIVVQPHQVDMNPFRRGDLVSVRGELSQRQMPQGAIPVYRVNDVQLIERGKQ